MDGLFGFTEALGIKHQVHDWRIPLSDADNDFAKKLIANKKTVLISPCSSERVNNFRNWPEKKFADLTDYLIEHDFQVILTGGPTEQEKQYGQTIQQLSKGELVVNLIGKTSLKQLYALIQEADLVIAPDSGPIHMANAARTPCIGLYASSNPLRTGPYHFQHLVVNKYPEAVQRFLHKNVTDIKWGRRVRNSDVMNMITTAEVIEKINIALGLSQT
jgi:heptosyltransferase I